MRTAMRAIAVLSLVVAGTFGGCTYNEGELRGLKGGAGGNRDSGNGDVPIGAGGGDGAMGVGDWGGGEAIDRAEREEQTEIDGRDGVDVVAGDGDELPDAEPVDAFGAGVGDVPIADAGGSGGPGGAGGADGGRSDGMVPDAPASGGAAGTGGATGAGGVAGTGGAMNTGGATVTGGASGTGGAAGSGGVTVTGGASGTGGAVGTGGTTAACQEGATECSGNGVRMCTSGRWSVTVACGPRQTCTGPAGTAKCSCNVDPVCASVGSTCSSASVLASCAQDAQACFYQSSATTCTNGACSGPAGSASCCTNACTAGTTQCLSSNTLQTCTVGANGCMGYMTTTCANGACSGPVGSASCCTNACIAGTTCLSGTRLETCAVSGNGCTTSASSTCASGLVCERLPLAACLDPTWAEWPMPNGQADVTAGAPNLAGYKDNGDGTVTDKVTGLMWQQATPAGTYTWSQAKAYCPTLTPAGYSDWRLPTLIELISLVDFGRSNPAIDTTYFPSTPSNYFWSASLVTGSSNSGWPVYFGSGDLAGRVLSLTYYIRCVR